MIVKKTNDEIVKHVNDENSEKKNMIYFLFNKIIDLVIWDLEKKLQWRIIEKNWKKNFAVIFNDSKNEKKAENKNSMIEISD